jgi:hypothetical protein
VEGFERGELSFFRLVRQILQSKSGIFGEKFNETSRKKGFPIATALHRNKSISVTCHAHLSGHFLQSGQSLNFLSSQRNPFFKKALLWSLKKQKRQNEPNTFCPYGIL